MTVLVLSWSTGHSPPRYDAIVVGNRQSCLDETAAIWRIGNLRTMTLRTRSYSARDRDDVSWTWKRRARRAR